jgi:putative oxidoreductase
MKKFFSTNYSQSAFNLATLALRVGFGLLICIDHGLSKLMHFSNMAASFFDPFHIGHRISLALVVFAEVFCAILLVLGLFTRFAALVLVINMAVAATVLFHKGLPLGQMEPALVFLVAFISILLVGPGRISVDSAMGK